MSVRLPSNFISIGACGTQSPVVLKLVQVTFFSSKYICIFTYNLHKSSVAQLCRWENWGTGKLNPLSMVLLFSVAKSCPTLCDPMDCSISVLSVLHHLPKFARVHVHCMTDAIQPSPLMLFSPSALSLSQHQGLFQWVSCLHQMTKILELQLQHQSFQWIFRVDLP